MCHNASQNHIQSILELAMFFSHYVHNLVSLYWLAISSTGAKGTTFAPNFQIEAKGMDRRKKKKKEKGIFISFKETHYIH